MDIEESKETSERRNKKDTDQIQTFNKPIVIEQKILIGETDIEARIREAAYYIALKRPTFEELCWSLAEKIQKKYNSKPSIEDIKRVAENIHNSSKTYDELCWLNAEIDMSAKK